MEESCETTPLLHSSSSEFLKLSTQQKKLAKTISGYILVLITGLCFITANVIQRIFAPEISHWHFMLYRSLFQIVIMLADVLWKGLNILGPPGTQRILLLIRGITGGLVILCIFFSLKNVPLGNVTAILFIMPIFTFIFAACLLKERLGCYRLAISILMIFGVVLIVRPPLMFAPDFNNGNRTSNNVNPSDPNGSRDQHVILGYICAVIAPLLAGLNSVLTRQLAALRTSLILLWFGIGGIIFTIPGILACQDWAIFNYTSQQWSYIATVTALCTFAQFIYTIAIKWVTPSRINVFRTNEVVISYLLQLALEPTVFHYSSVVGMALLFAAVTLIAAESEVMQKYSQRLKFL